MKNFILKFKNITVLDLFFVIILFALVFVMIYSCYYNKRQQINDKLSYELLLKEQSFVYEHSEEYSSFTSCVKIYDRYYCKND